MSISFVIMTIGMLCFALLFWRASNRNLDYETCLCLVYRDVFGARYALQSFEDTELANEFLDNMEDIIKHSGVSELDLQKAKATYTPQISQG